MTTRKQPKMYFVNRWSDDGICLRIAGPFRTWEEAEQVCDEYKRRNPKLENWRVNESPVKKQDWWEFYRKGVEQFNGGLYRDAIESLEFASELNPDEDSFYYLLGLAQYQLELYQEAIESFEHAIKMNPDYANTYFNLALAQDALGICPSAKKNFKKYLDLDEGEIPKTSECVEYAKKRIQELTTADEIAVGATVDVEFNEPDYEITDSDLVKG